MLLAVPFVKYDMVFFSRFVTL